MNVVCFDKTGTLTTGNLTVTDVIPTEGVSETALLYYAACAETGSEHSIAKAVLDHAKKTVNPDTLKSIAFAHGFKAVPGRGAQAIMAGAPVLVGNAEFLSDNNIPIHFSKEIFENQIHQSNIMNFRLSGKTILYVAQAGKFLGCIAVHDEVRPNAALTIESLKQRGF